VIQRVLQPLGYADYTRIMQALIQGVDNPPLVPLMVVAGVVASLFVVIKLRHERDSTTWKLMFWGALLFLVGVLGVTVLLNHPINQQIQKWASSAPPADWQTVRERWNSLNYLRTSASAVAFVLFTLALLQPLPDEKK
jgi:uncharacterized membrane protein